MTFDVSSVTDGLIKLVSSSWSAAPIWSELQQKAPTFTPGFTGLAPDAIRSLGGAQLSVFLYHVESDVSQEATFWSSQMVSQAEAPVSYLPLALNLFYLVSAYSEASYAEEQQAMSVALRILHGNAVVSSATGVTPAWRLTLTMEHRSYEELSGLWQAMAAPLRLGVVYRAAVVFLPGATAPAPAAEVKTLKADVNGDVVTIPPA